MSTPAPPPPPQTSGPVISGGSRMTKYGETKKAKLLTHQSRNFRYHFATTTHKMDETASLGVHPLHRHRPPFPPPPPPPPPPPTPTPPTPHPPLPPLPTASFPNSALPNFFTPAKLPESTLTLLTLKSTKSNLRLQTQDGRL